jgi:hypothetical protein
VPVAVEDREGDVIPAHLEERKAVSVSAHVWRGRGTYALNSFVRMGSVRINAASASLFLKRRRRDVGCSWSSLGIAFGGGSARAVGVGIASAGGGHGGRWLVMVRAMGTRRVRGGFGCGLCGSHLLSRLERDSTTRHALAWS